MYILFNDEFGLSLKEIYNASRHGKNGFSGLLFNVKKGDDIFIEVDAVTASGIIAELYNTGQCDITQYEVMCVDELGNMYPY